ncbi:hypothetical protein HZA97_07035 [Candidatus Woesearchaeota archaeon]|nr:hypothetical protein [Candidatus Woesearchaeota archaeon]
MSDGEIPSQDAQGLPIVASVRTGLVGKDDAIMRRVPIEYAEKTIRNVIDHLVGSTDITDTELSLAESVRRELNEVGSVVVANQKTAKLGDLVKQYLVEKEHELPDGTKKPFRELEIEISAVQQGGNYFI